MSDKLTFSPQQAQRIAESDFGEDVPDSLRQAVYEEARASRVRVERRDGRLRFVLYGDPALRERLDREIERYTEGDQ